MEKTLVETDSEVLERLLGLKLPSEYELEIRVHEGTEEPFATVRFQKRAGRLIRQLDRLRDLGLTFS